MKQKQFQIINSRSLQVSSYIQKSFILIFLVLQRYGRNFKLCSLAIKRIKGNQNGNFAYGGPTHAIIFLNINRLTFCQIYTDARMELNDLFIKSLLVISPISTDFYSSYNQYHLFKLNKLQYQAMTQTNDFSIDSIMKKYEQRQYQLTKNNKECLLESFEMDKNKLSYELHNKSGASTPEFSNITTRKERKENNESYIQKTHKKNEVYESFIVNDAAGKNCNTDLQKKEYQKLLAKLDQTEQKLTRSEKNYAEMWRKYQKLLKEGQKSEKQIEIEHKLKQKEVQEQRIRLESYERQIKNLKQCLNVKQTNISAFKDKLSEKHLRIVQTQRAFQTLKSEFQLVRAKQQQNQQQRDSQTEQKDRIITQLRQQLQKFGGILNEKQKQKKNLLLQLQKNYLSHKEQLQILRMSYQKVEEEYKEWIQSCSKQKLALIESYETKLKEHAKSLTNNHYKKSSIQLLEQQALQKTQEITFLIAQNLKINNQLKSAKIQLENSERGKLQLIGKLSSLQNGVIEKIQYCKSLETSYNKLQNIYKSQQQKNKQLSAKNNLLNRQFQQLKNKCSVLFSEMQGKKQSKNSESLEIIRLKKQIMVCKQQLERTRNNEMILHNKLNQSLSILKNKSLKHEQEKEDIMTDLLAQRLENAKLREQLKQNKEVLQKEYQLSLQNLRKQMEEKINTNALRPLLNNNQDIEKQQLYLQLRQLQRRYELLASEVVTVDQMISLSNKVQRRHQLRK